MSSSHSHKRKKQTPKSILQQTSRRTSWLLLIYRDSCLCTLHCSIPKYQKKKNSSTKWHIKVCNCCARICRQAAPIRQQMHIRQTQIVCTGWLSGGTENVAETTAGEGNHLTSPRWSHTSITCSWRNPWWVSVGNTRQRHETAKRPDISCLPLCLNRAATTTRTTGCKGVLAIVTVQPTGLGNNGYAPNCFSCKNRWQLATSHSPLIHLLSSLASDVIAVLHSHTCCVW